MKFTKKILAAMLLSSTLLMTGCGEMDIGTVDIEKIEDTPQMKAIIDEGHQKLEDLQNQLLTETQDKSEDEMMKAAEEFQRKAAGIRQAYDTQLRHKLDTVLAEISEQKKLDAVVESSKNSPTVFKGGIDVTEEVVQKLQ